GEFAPAQVSGREMPLEEVAPQVAHQIVPLSPTTPPTTGTRWLNQVAPGLRQRASDANAEGPPRSATGLERTAPTDSRDSPTRSSGSLLIATQAPSGNETAPSASRL